jgi:hypothetical protein
MILPKRGYLLRLDVPPKNQQTDTPMTSISLEHLLTTLYIWIDDWYKAEGEALVGRVFGRKPQFSDSEMLTLMVAHDFVPFPGEAQYIGFIRANYLPLFPRLLDQSQYNRRAIKLRWVLEPLRQSVLRHLGVNHPEHVLVDTKPIPVVGYTRSKNRSDFREKAAYGYCSAKKMRYFGYKLTLVSTLDGIPLRHDLVPADTEERLAVEGVISKLKGCDVIGDKGFIGEKWQGEMRRELGHKIWTVKRENQAKQNPILFDRMLNKIRSRIEGVFNSIQNTGRPLERLLAKTEAGLHTRVSLKLLSHTFNILFQRCFNIKVLSFSISH